MKISSVVLLSAVAAIACASRQRSHLYAPERFERRGLIDGSNTPVNEHIASTLGQVEKFVVKRDGGVGHLLDGLPLTADVSGKDGKGLLKRDGGVGHLLDGLPVTAGVSGKDGKGLLKRDGSVGGLLKSIPAVGDQLQGKAGGLLRKRSPGVGDMLKDLPAVDGLGNGGGLL